jgi:hypothetical protein
MVEPDYLWYFGYNIVDTRAINRKILNFVIVLIINTFADQVLLVYIFTQMLLSNHIVKF